MIRFAAQRLALGVLVVVGVVVLTFLIARVIPGDPAVTYAGPRASRAQLEQTRRQLGLDKPVIVQLGDYLKGIATGDAVGKQTPNEHSPSREQSSVTEAPSPTRALDAKCWDVRNASIQACSSGKK